MKNKPVRHKEDNTFKFIPFSERVSNLGINVFHRIAHEYETQNEEEKKCCFYQSIEKWNVLNLSESYGDFKRDVRPGDNITLAQLIYNKDNVVEVLLKHLKYKNILCLQTLLEIVVALIQDLQTDFYQYYPDFLNVLIDFLNTKDIDQLEWTFTCLAYIFKLLWRILIKDIHNVFNTLLPLLSDTKAEYINIFAAESFAFVARKVKDKKTFVQSVLRTLKNSKDSIAGCGRLFFEVINGINGQFHSCAEVWLTIYFELLGESKTSGILFNVLEEVVRHIVNNIYSQNSDVFWKIVINFIQKILQSWSENKEKKINLILQCIGQALEYKSGHFLTQPDHLIKELLKLFALPDLPNDILLSATKIVILLLLSRNIRLQQEQASLLVRTVLSVQFVDIFLFFIENTFEYSSFDLLICPSFLKYCVKSKLSETSLKILTKLITTKSPLCESGINISKWSRYPLDFNADNKIIETILLEHVSLQKHTLDSNRNNYIYSLICLPHINYDPEVENILSKNIDILCNIIKERSNIKMNLFLLLITFECIAHTSNHNKLIVLKETFFDTLLPLCTNIEYICALKVLDMFLTLTKKEMVNLDNITWINGNLRNNFNSPYSEVRLYTSHIYSLFDDVLQKHFNNPVEEWRVFSLCYTIQCIKPHINTYREQLIQLDKFNFDRPQMSMCKATEFKTIPLRYLCGTLYINFKLLWDPVIKLIASHAFGLDINVFWDVFGEELRTAANNVNKQDEVNGESYDFKEEFLNDLYSNICKISVKPDFTNYRLLIWKAMCLFPQIAEAKTKDVSVLFLNFIENEYKQFNADNALTWNVKQNDLPENDLGETNIQEITTGTQKIGRKIIIRTLIQQLEVFSKVHSAKSMYKEPELYKLYFDLLSHKNSEVQKLALDCIMTYRFKYLTPYKDHLYNLIDDKNFKNELVAFKVDQESAMIQAEHRNDLIPVIMKIVLSKMMSKTGLRTGGKSSGQFRRNIVFRFLAGCQENEMMNFIHMAFKYYTNYIQDDPMDMISAISSTMDLEKFIPPKRLQSTLNLINVVLEQFGALMGDELLKYLLKIILITGTFIKAGFDQQNNLHAGYVALFRNLRTSNIKILGRFFSLFENYPWTSNEIDSIYEVFIWPYLKKLPIEGIHSPTALLKLLVIWGSYPRYFNLLVKHYDNDNNYYPLSYIILLLLNEKSRPSVNNLIFEMIEKLLTLQPDEHDIKMKISFHNELNICEDLQQKLNSKESFNYGSCILLPHADSVLEKIKLKIENKSKNINQRELLILSRISELVWQPDLSDKLLQLLLPIVMKKCMLNVSEEILLQLMTTLTNLMENIEKPEKHLKQISPLFSEVTYPSSRRLLCQLLSTIAKGGAPDFVLTNEIMTKVNSWDSKWINQPDFQVRGDTFKKIQTMIADDAINLELGILLIYNCFYLLKSEKDLALKENSSHCLRTISTYLIKKYSKLCDQKYILDETLLSLIRYGLKSKNYDLRNDCILLLGYLSRECPDVHVVLRDLHKLTNKQDLEVDFFENLTHLQIHRHGRALQKFSNIYRQEITLPNIRSLTQFILPLTTHYLCNVKYANKNSVIDAAIEAVETICKLLPWYQYEGLLKFYLSKLQHKVEYQKQLVRLIVTILDSFHFDLSKSQVEVIKQKFEDSVIDTDNIENRKEKQLQVGENVELDESIAEENVGQLKDEVEIEEILEDLQNLEGEEDVKAEEEKHGEQDLTNSLKAFEKVTVLCKSTATRVIHTIQVVLLPQLHKALAEMTHHESSHKINRKKTSMEREEDDLLKVPISLALVKLLQKLPKGILDANLPGVFMKLCTFLKSHLESVRRAAKETLQKIMIALGPPYLSLLLYEIVPLLNRGFQVHVLVYTVHSILGTLKEMFQPKDIDINLNTIIKLCKADLFGVLAEEKEVNKIVNKVSEAKATKSFDTFHILGQYITEKCILDLILPIKEILSTSHSFKAIYKAQECLKHIALGLIDNAFVSVGSLLKFSFGVANENIPELVTANQSILTEKEREKMERQKPDSFIIAKEPVYRSGNRISNVRSSNKTNAHIMIEFGLRLCYLLLKRGKIRDDDYRPFLDPFVSIFKNCLKSKSVKLSTITLQCLGWCFKYDLPSLEDSIVEIAELIFEILHKYGAAGLSKGDNFDLVVAAFKAMTVLVRDVKYFIVKPEQLKVLLLYVEQDLHDYDRQAIAFGLLKAILSRKLITSELFDVMIKVADLSITSELPHVRLQSRLAMHQFLMDYPLGKKLDKHVSFYLSQLKYETQAGRESGIEMIQSLINSFPMKVLKEYSGTFFITLGARLINDSEPVCRKMVADCINSMLSRLSKSDRDPLFNIVKVWLSEENLTHKGLAAQMCGILVTVEKTSFETRISNLMPLIKSQFGIFEENNKPGKFVKLKKEDETDSEEMERTRDHHLFQVLQLLLKISAQCPAFFKQIDDIEEISKAVQLLLAYPHDWVRLASVQFLGFVLSSLDCKNLEYLILNNKSTNGYLQSYPIDDIKSLTLDLCDQLQPNCVKSDLAEQVVKNLVFIARVIQNIPIDRHNKINLIWLAKRMRRIVNLEITETPTSVILRTEVFKWIAGVATALDLKNVNKILHHLLAPLLREIVTTEGSEASIRQLSKEVSNLIKKKIGVEKYTETISNLEQQLSIKRAERKRSRNQLAITDPDIYAKKKIRHHEKKKEAKKRKISERKGSVKKFKRKKVVELDNSEIM